MIEQAKGVYGFAHLTFQEYFTAKHIAEMDEKDWVNLFRYYRERQWREIFLLTASLFTKADNFFHQFCAYLDQIISYDAKLLALVTWANSKAKSSAETIEEIFPHRCYYIYLDRFHSISHTLNLALDYALALNPHHSSDFIHPFANFDPLFQDTQDFIPGLRQALTITLEKSHADTLARAYSIYFDAPFQYFADVKLNQGYIGGSLASEDRMSSFYSHIPTNFDSALTHMPIHLQELGLASVRAHDYSLDLITIDHHNTVRSSAIALDYALFHSWLYGQFGWRSARPFIKLVREISEEKGFSSLLNRLNSANVHDYFAPPTKSKSDQFPNLVWQIAQDERKLRLFELTKEETERFADYLQGMALFVECLKLAAVTDRKEIMANLLVPPLVPPLLVEPEKPVKRESWFGRIWARFFSNKTNK